MIYLSPISSELVQQTSFVVENTRHEFEVIRLWEQPTEPFLETPALLPFAVLTKAADKTQILRQVAQKIDQIPEPRVRSNITGSAFVLAGLRLERETISKILKRDIMRESTTYQWIIEEGETTERQRIAIKLLNEEISIDVISRVTGLSIAEIQLLQTNRSQN